MLQSKLSAWWNQVIVFAAINQPASVYKFQQMCLTLTSPGRPVGELGLTALLDLPVPERQRSYCLVFCIMQWVLNFVWLKILKCMGDGQLSCCIQSLVSIMKACET